MTEGHNPPRDPNGEMNQSDTLHDGTDRDRLEHEGVTLEAIHAKLEALEARVATVEKLGPQAHVHAGSGGMRGETISASIEQAWSTGRERISTAWTVLRSGNVPEARQETPKDVDGGTMTNQAHDGARTSDATPTEIPRRQRPTVLRIVAISVLALAGLLLAIEIGEELIEGTAPLQVDTLVTTSVWVDDAPLGWVTQ